MFEDRIKELTEKGLLRRVIDKEGPQGHRIILEGREYINFSSNDYLGLANHPKIKEAVINAIYEYGTGAGASRLLGGGSILHRRLEERIAEFKGTPCALVMNSGYTANTSVIPVLAGNGDAIFSDELNHASIIDGCRLSKADVYIYKHRDMEELEGLLKKSNHGRRLIITDSVFSMDGDIAPLSDIIELAERYDALLYIDDAHATGVLGKGRGSLRHFNIEHKDYIIQMGTFSKALGSFGAYIAGGRSLIEYLINRARGFIYSTALPPHIIAHILEALRIIDEHPDIIERLWENRERMRDILESLGYDISISETPIMPLICSDTDEANRLSEFLRDNGIYAPSIRPPTVKISRIRFTVTSLHTLEDMEGLRGVLEEWKRRSAL